MALVVNDRVAKEAWPGLVTGKVSDVAGLFLFPLVLVAVVEAAAALSQRSPPPRSRAVAAAAAATAVVFASIKTVPAAGDAYQVVFGWLRWPLGIVEHWATGDDGPVTMRVRLVQDPSDLLALPAAGLAWWAHGRPPSPARRRRTEAA